MQAYVPLASVLLLRTCKNPVKERLGVTLVLAVHVALHAARALLLSTTCYSMHCCHIENSSTLMEYFVHTEDTQCTIGRMYIVRIMVNSCSSLSHFHSKHTPRECYGKQNWSTTEPLWDKTQGSVSHFQWSTEYLARSRLLISRYSTWLQVFK